MRILMISQHFNDNSMGSVRPTRLTYWLTRYGHQVDVISNQGYFNANQFFENNSSEETSTIIESKRKSKISQVRFGNFVPKNMRFSRSVINEWISSFRWARTNLKKINRDYDAIFSSIYPVGALILGCGIKRKKGTAWVCDLRDLLTDEQWPNWLNRLSIILNRRYIKYADVVTTVSSAAKKALQIQLGDMCRVETIYNGFECLKDFEAIQLENEIIKPHVPLTICYTGTMYGGRRDATPLFEAIAALIDSQIAEENLFRIEYAGPNYEQMADQARRYGLEGIVHDNGKLRRIESKKLQQSCDLLLLLTWNTQREQGVLTGKFFEYLGQNKPILVIVAGDKQDSEIKEMLDKMRLGFTFEEAQHELGICGLKEFLLNSLECVRNGEPIVSNKNDEYIKEFSYKKHACKLIDLFKSINFGNKQ